MKFNENLKYLRKEAGLTQEQLAEQLNVSRQAVTKWESGQSLPDIENLKEISYIFSISLDNLVGDIESKSTLRIKKKIDDLGYFIFAFYALLIFNIVSSISILEQFIVDSSIIILIIISMFIIGTVIFAILLKLYFRSRDKIIVNMQPNKKGKKERKYYIIKKSIILFFCTLIYMCISDIYFLFENPTTFLINIIAQTIPLGIIITTAYGVLSYIDLEKKVSKLNKNEDM